jgi:predicted GNAT family acetyltransferase
MTYDIRNNEQESRFETTVDGETAVVEYFVEGDTITFTHTLVPEAIGGRGVAQELVKSALEHARGSNMKVVPQCSYVATYIKRNPEYGELVAG